MKSLFAVVGLFSLLLFADSVHTRKDPGEYWHGIMKDQPIPEAIQGLLDVGAVKKRDCHTSTEARSNDLTRKQEKGFAKVFEPIPNISVYQDGAKLKEVKSFENDFEPRPNLSADNDDIGVKGDKFIEDFEPRPILSADH